MTDGDGLDLRSYVPGIITHLSNKLSRGASALYRRHFGIGIIEWRVIAQLKVAPGSSARAICDVTGLDKAAVSRSFELLMARRFIRLQGSHGRERPATLTADGRRLHDRIIGIALERERRLLACLTTQERQTLATLLRRIETHIDGVAEPLDIADFAGEPSARRRLPRS